MDPDGRRLISAVDQGKLLAFLGIEDPVVWERRWRQTGAATTALILWHPDASCDWLWSLGIPILSLADHCLELRNRGIEADSQAFQVISDSDFSL